MYQIVRKVSLNPTVTLMEIEAPYVAAKAEAGQFIILRVDAEGERIPLTVAGYDRAAGTVRIIFQIVGATTEKLNHKNEGEYIEDFAGRSASPPKRTDCAAFASGAAALAVPSRFPLPKSCARWAVRSPRSSASAPRIC